MKKLVLTACALLAALSMHAQGCLTFANSAASLITIKNKDTGVVSNVPKGSTAYTIGLFYAPDGTTDKSAFQLGATCTFAPTADGRFNAGKATLASVNPVGANVAVMLRGWETSYGTTAAAYDAAYGKGYTAESAIFSANTSDPGNSLDTPGVLTGVGQFAGMQLAVVPEPSTIALGILGLAGLFVLRRRS